MADLTHATEKRLDRGFSAEETAIQFPPDCDQEVVGPELSWTQYASQFVINQETGGKDFFNAAILPFSTPSTIENAEKFWRSVIFDWVRYIPFLRMIVRPKVAGQESCAEDFVHVFLPADWENIDFRVIEDKERFETETEDPMDLRKGPPLRVLLWATGPDREIRLVINEINSDNAGLAVLTDAFGKITMLKLGKKISAPIPPVKMCDFPKILKDAVAARESSDAAFWKSVVESMPKDGVKLSISAHCPASGQYSGRIRNVSRQMTEKQVSGMVKMTEDYNSTCFRIITSVYQLLLHLYTGESVNITTNVDVTRFVPELKGVLTKLINGISLYADFKETGGATIKDFLQKNSSVIQQSVEHGLYPADRIQALVEAHMTEITRKYPKHKINQERVGFWSFRKQFVQKQGTNFQFKGLILNTLETIIETQIRFYYDKRNPNNSFIVFELSQDAFSEEEAHQIKEDFFNLLDYVIDNPDGIIADIPWDDMAQYRSSCNTK
ncbi:uncharacterized protein LOC106174356 [Lingula anatina]|uniref:Uncharacterized protein LOC106174356 n=1 Tax=Lingula anatina TaxID=7574 RepID=A0A1S3JMI8_LINAN|nr:uncharacterized protein LOC106174356 [Lingula anatina]|eukprot:XP_013411351.1 uncharacterized protein LOC106174356 [Lingula anatina]